MKALQILSCLFVLTFLTASAEPQDKKADAKKPKFRFAPLYLQKGEEIPKDGFVGIDKATIAAYQKIGAVWILRHPSNVPWICFSGFLSERKLDLSAKFPDPGVEFGLHFTEAAPMTDAGMKQLADLKNLTFLHLTYTKVTDAGLKELAGLKKLKRLELQNDKISDTTLRTLRDVGLLHTLAGANINPTDTFRGDGKTYWQSADELTMFSLMATKVTDAGLKELALFKNLDKLILVLSPITGTGLKHLSGLKKLRSLELSKATDEGLKTIASFKDLTSLMIFSNKEMDTEAEITDAGLKELAGLQRLSSLSLFQCPKITDAGVAALRKALPKCKIKVER